MDKINGFWIVMFIVIGWAVVFNLIPKMYRWWEGKITNAYRERIEHLERSMEAVRRANEWYYTRSRLLMECSALLPQSAPAHCPDPLGETQATAWVSRILALAFCMEIFFSMETASDPNHNKKHPV